MDDTTYRVTFETNSLSGKLALDDMEDVIRHALSAQGITLIKDTLTAGPVRQIIALCDICEGALTDADTEKCPHCNTVWAKPAKCVGTFVATSELCTTCGLTADEHKENA